MIYHESPCAPVLSCFSNPCPKTPGISVPLSDLGMTGIFSFYGLFTFFSSRLYLCKHSDMVRCSRRTKKIKFAFPRIGLPDISFLQSCSLWSNLFNSFSRNSGRKAVYFALFYCVLHKQVISHGASSRLHLLTFITMNLFIDVESMMQFHRE